MSDPNDLGVYRDGGDDRDIGWLLGISIGSKKKSGDWYIKYSYQKLEDYAFPAVFVDSDFHGGGTNNKGHYIKGGFLPSDSLRIEAAGFFTKRDKRSKDGKKDENRIQADVVFSF